jgi:hypothetical protein
MIFTLNHKRKFTIGITLALLIGLNACKKFVQIPLPTSQLVTATVFSDNITATAAQLAIYTKMSGESYKMAASCGLLSDELKNYSANALSLQYYTNSLQPLSSPGPWINAYNYIYQANAIIEGLQNNGKISTVVATQLTGESKFVRAFWYFYLVNIYGDVPLVLTTNYTVNNSLARTSQAQVYQQIVADLKDAEVSLNSNYVDITDTTVTTERVRPTKGAAAALLARVYLFNGKYDTAEAEATTVLSNGLYSLCANLSGNGGVFQANSSEAIWQLQTPLPSSSSTGDGLNFILTKAPSTTSAANSATISVELQASFEPGDNRKANWIGGFPTAAPLYYFPYKYQAGRLPSSVTDPSGIPEYTMVLRLAEQYLIRAEARVLKSSPNIPGALNDLNAIRNRAGLTSYSGATDQSSLLAAIMHERQVELFAEWGHRWFDLKRTGKLDAIMGGPSGVAHAKGGTWVITDQLFPIPSTEIISNIHLIQNPGY